jgi:hypothetical protein
MDNECWGAELLPLALFYVPSLIKGRFHAQSFMFLLFVVQGGISALLSYLDFFPAAVQRSAVSTAAAMAARTSVDTIDCALQAMPQLLPLLEFQDHRIVDSAAAALNGITDAAARYVSV